MHTYSKWIFFLSIRIENWSRCHAIENMKKKTILSDHLQTQTVWKYDMPLCVLYPVIILLKYFVSIEISIIPIFIYASQLTRQKVYFSHNNGKCRANDAIGMLKLYSYISYQLGSFIASKVNKHIVSTANFRNTVFSCSLFLSIFSS